MAKSEGLKIGHSLFLFLKIAQQIHLGWEDEITKQTRVWSGVVTLITQQNNLGKSRCRLECPIKIPSLRPRLWRHHLPPPNWWRCRWSSARAWVASPHAPAVAAAWEATRPCAAGMMRPRTREGPDRTCRKTGLRCRCRLSLRLERRSTAWLCDSTARSPCFCSPFEDALGNSPFPEKL